MITRCEAGRKKSKLLEIYAIAEDAALRRVEDEQLMVCAHGERRRGTRSLPEFGSKIDIQLGFAFTIDHMKHSAVAIHHEN